MKVKRKIFFGMLLSILWLPAYCQLSVLGDIIDQDGEPAPEVGLFLSLQSGKSDAIYTVTDAQGQYSFVLEVPETNPTGCFDITMLDCNGTLIGQSDCYDSSNLNFSHDFSFCENGTTICQSFITITPVDGEDSILLSTINAGIGPYEYVWSDESIEPSLTLSSTVKGDYCVTVTDTEGCISENCITLDPLDPCFVFIEVSQAYQSTTLTAFAYTDYFLSYEWNTGDTLGVIQITESGEYCVTVTDSKGCTTSDCVIIEVDPTDWLTCDVEISQYVNEADNLNFLKATPIGNEPFEFKWTSNNVLLGQDSILNVNINGEYCVIVISDDGCSNSDCYIYEANEECSANIFQEEDGTLLVGVNGTAPFQVLWSTGETSSVIAPTEEGEYCVTIYDGLGCQATDCITYILGPVPDCDGEIRQMKINENEYQLTGYSINDGIPDFDTYDWSTGQTSQDIVVNTEGYYCVTITHISGCEFTDCIYLSYNNTDIDEGLAITYFDSESQNTVPCKIELYQKNLQGFYNYYKDINAGNLQGIDNIYYDPSIDDGQYLVRAIPDDETSYVPSYANNDLFWEGSQKITVENGGEGLNDITNILAIPKPTSTGPGEIVGVVLEFEQAFNVMLFLSDTLINQSTVSFNEEFIFQNLPYGTYTIIVDFPGRDRKERTVTLSPDNISEYVELFTNVTNAKDVDDKLVFSAYPNPTSNEVFISSSLLVKQDIEVMVSDYSGHIKFPDFHKVSDDKISINLEKESAGIYTIIVKSSMNTSYIRVLKI